MPHTTSRSFPHRGCRPPAGHGWRNALCETAFVACRDEARPADGDQDLLAARWPAWHARLAGFLMDDPLRARRGELRECMAALAAQGLQRDMFAVDEGMPGEGRQ